MSPKLRTNLDTAEKIKAGFIRAPEDETKQHDNEYSLPIDINPIGAMFWPII